jgi:hypothetical protein
LPRAAAVTAAGSPWLAGQSTPVQAAPEASGQEAGLAFGGPAGLEIGLAAAAGIAE